MVGRAGLGSDSIARPDGRVKDVLFAYVRLATRSMLRYGLE